MKDARHQDLLKPTHAAKLIGITRGAISYAMKQGLIAVTEIGPARLITKSEALRYKHHRPVPGRKKKATNPTITQKNKNT